MSQSPCPSAVSVLVQKDTEQTTEEIHRKHHVVILKVTWSKEEQDQGRGHKGWGGVRELRFEIGQSGKEGLGEKGISVRSLSQALTEVRGRPWDT